MDIYKIKLNTSKAFNKEFYIFKIEKKLFIDESCNTMLFYEKINIHLTLLSDKFIFDIKTVNKINLFDYIKEKTSNQFTNELFIYYYIPFYAKELIKINVKSLLNSKKLKYIIYDNF